MTPSSGCLNLPAKVAIMNVQNAVSAIQMERGVSAVTANPAPIPAPKSDATSRAFVGQ